MSILRSSRSVDAHNIDRLVTTLTRDLVTIVREVAGIADVVYRNLRPTDFLNGTLTGRLTNPGTLTANTYAVNAWSTFKLSATQAVGIYGIVNLTPNPQLDEITFVAGPKTLSINPINELYADTDGATKGFFIPPPVWMPNEVVNIGLLSGAGQTINLEQIVFLGIVAEQENLVAPPRILVPGAGPGAPARVPGSF